MTCRVVRVLVCSFVLFGWSFAAIRDAAAQAPAGNPLTDDDRELFGKLDVNRDALLTKIEIGAWPWARFDTNSDDKVSIVEFLTGRSDDRRKAATSDDDQEVWKLLDWTDDGVLSGTELDRGLWAAFDGDKSGEVSKDEFLAARKLARDAAKPAPKVEAPGNDQTKPAGGAGEWTTVEGNGFKLVMPGTPDKTTGPVDTKHGKREVTQYQLLTDNGDTGYIVFESDTQATPEQLAAQQPLEELVQIAAEDKTYKLLDHEKISLGTYPGRELMATGQNLMLRKRAYLVGGRLIQLVVATGDNSTASPAMIKRFMDSLEITGTPPTNYVPKADTAAADLETEIGALLESGNYQQAIDKLTAEVNAKPDELLPRFLRAVAWLQMGEYQKSIDDNNEVIRRQNNIPSTYNNRGWAYVMQGKYDEAITDFDAALRLDPTLSMSLKNRGWARFAKGQLNEAATDLAAALKQKADFGWARFNLAMVYQAQGDFRRAAEQYEQALQLEPNYPSLLGMYAWMLATCPDEQFRDGAKAFRLAKHGFELTSREDAVLLEALAAAEAETGNFETAVQTQAAAVAMLGKEAGDDENARLSIYRAARPYRDRGDMAAKPKIVAAGAVDPRYPLHGEKTAEQATNPFAEPPAAATTETKKYTNARDGLNEKLAGSYVNFSFEYPADWRMTRTGEKEGSGTYVDVERIVQLDGQPYIVDSCSVGYLKLEGPPALATLFLQQLADDLTGKFSQQFENFKKVSEGEVTIADSPGYEVRYTATLEMPTKGRVTLYGRLIVLSAAAFGGNGVTLSLVATDAETKISDVKQVGAEGPLKALLDSFKFAKAE